MDFEKYKTVDPKVKVIHGKDSKDTERKLQAYVKENENRIKGIKRGTDTMYFVFYWEV